MIDYTKTINELKMLLKVYEATGNGNCYHADIFRDAIEALEFLTETPFDSEDVNVNNSSSEDSIQTKNIKQNVIYCGDCKYIDSGIDEDGNPFLKCLNGRSYGGTRINDFCSWGERK